MKVCECGFNVCPYAYWTERGELLWKQKAWHSLYCDKVYTCHRKLRDHRCHKISTFFAYRLKLSGTAHVHLFSQCSTFKQFHVALLCLNILTFSIDAMISKLMRTSTKHFRKLSFANFIFYVRMLSTIEPHYSYVAFDMKIPWLWSMFILNKFFAHWY